MKFGSGSILTLSTIAVVLICDYSNLSRVRCDHYLGSIRGHVACGFTLELPDTLFTDKIRTSPEQIKGETDIVTHEDINKCSISSESPTQKQRSFEEQY